MIKSFSFYFYLKFLHLMILMNQILILLQIIKYNSLKIYKKYQLRYKMHIKNLEKIILIRRIYKDIININKNYQLLNQQ